VLRRGSRGACAQANQRCRSNHELTHVAILQ
jgi:hypothetical protein